MTGEVARKQPSLKDLVVLLYSARYEVLVTIRRRPRLPAERVVALTFAMKP